MLSKAKKIARRSRLRQMVRINILLKQMRKERRNIEKEYNIIDQEFLEEQGLARQFPTRFRECYFFYNHLATTEQRAEIDDNIWQEETSSPTGGATITARYASHDFIDNMDKYLG